MSDIDEKEINEEGENEYGDFDINNSYEGEEDLKENQYKKIIISKEQIEEYNKKKDRKGICYISKIPPYMKVSTIRNLLKPYNVERIYLAPEDSIKRQHRIKKGGNRKNCFTDGWIEFSDKKIAKIVALSLNCTKMIQKKTGFYSSDLWNIKYLPKFKWENLTEKLAYEQRIKKEKLNFELDKTKKEKEFYMEKFETSKRIMGIINQKEKKSLKDDSNELKVIKKVKENNKEFNKVKREYNQRKPLN